MVKGFRNGSRQDLYVSGFLKNYLCQYKNKKSMDLFQIKKDFKNYVQGNFGVKVHYGATKWSWLISDICINLKHSDVGIFFSKGI